MADRCLIWHIPGTPYPPSLPQYYLEADYEKGAVRIFAETAPFGGDLKVDILAGGVSIFVNHALEDATPDTTISLPQGMNSEDAAENFTGEDLAEGTWVSCQLVSAGGARNITVQLELNDLT